MDADISWASRLTGTAEPTLTERVEADLRDVTSAIALVEIGLAAFEEARRKLGDLALSPDVDTAEERLREILHDTTAALHDEVLARLNVGEELQRAYRGGRDL